MTTPVRDLPLLLLGEGSDPASERGVDCPGELPPASDPALVERARAAKAALGDSVFVLGHHYQRDEVIQFADVTGDSFKLAQKAAARPEAPYIVFCGVHFMAESADILTAPHQKVILPDLGAGCSMADMATFDQVEECWDVLEDAEAVPGVVDERVGEDGEAVDGAGVVGADADAVEGVVAGGVEGDADVGGRVLLGVAVDEDADVLGA